MGKPESASGRTNCGRAFVNIDFPYR
jgi:hypothetical protein